MESVNQRLNASSLDQLSVRELRALLLAMVDAINNMATKLDTAGGTVTQLGTDYASTTKTFLTK